MIAASFVLALTLQTATKIQPGVEYEGPIALEAPSVGVGFTLPAGWSGGLPQGSDFFLMAPPGEPGYIFVGAEEMTVAEAAEAMGERVPLGDGVTLSPSSEVEINDAGNALVGDYAVEGTARPVKSTARTIVGDHGTGIFFIAVFPDDHADAFRDALSAAADSVRFFVAVEEATPEGAVSAEALSGRKITRFYTTSGYSETETIHLCASGAFYRNAESGGFGGGASGAFQSQNAGRWSVQGEQLVLAYGDGSTATYALELDGTKLMLDGRRWFREATDCR